MSSFVLFIYFLERKEVCLKNKTILVRLLKWYTFVLHICVFMVEHKEHVSMNWSISSSTELLRFVELYKWGCTNQNDRFRTHHVCAKTRSICWVTFEFCSKALFLLTNIWSCPLKQRLKRVFLRLSWAPLSRQRSKLQDICFNLGDFIHKNIARFFREGNDAFLAKNYVEAIKHYTKAIEFEPNTAIFYSNRRLVVI